MALKEIVKAYFNKHVHVRSVLSKSLGNLKWKVLWVTLFKEDMWIVFDICF